MKPKVALVQMVSSQNVDTSLDRLDVLINEAVRSNPEAIFLPENFACLGNPDPNATGQQEKTSNGPIRSCLSELARRHNCWLFAGTLPVACRPDGSAIDGNRVRAASIVYDQTGSEVCRYDKMHLFDVNVRDNIKRYRESETFEPGEETVVVDSPIGCVGLSVCYDIRFPEFYRQLALAGASVITVPSAFTEVTGAAHFELLMRARAVENCVFTIAACQGGVHDSGRRTYGHSMVVDPWGDVLGELSQGEGVLIAELDMARRDQVVSDLNGIANNRLLS